MSNIIFNLFHTIVGGNKKTTSSGWTTFNGNCCIHNGEKRKDTRSRAGIKEENGCFVYHCFNCGFSTIWKEGDRLGSNIKKLLTWSGVPEDEIRLLNFQLWKNRSSKDSDIRITHDIHEPSFNVVSLPPESILIKDSIQSNETNIDFLDILVYLNGRGEYLLDYDFYWSKNREHSRKIIIPFHWNSQIVGYTERLIDKANIRYIKNIQQNYIFNNHLIKNPNRKFLLIMEGVLDAIGVDGLALLGNGLSINQSKWINQFDGEKIIVPDRDHSGRKLVEYALQHDWSVSFPVWEEDCKDVSEACKRYGRIYTLYSILQGRTSNKLKIKLEMERLYK